MLEMIIKDFINGSTQMLIGGLIIGMTDSLREAADHLIKQHYGIIEPLYKEVKPKKWYKIL